MTRAADRAAPVRAFLDTNVLLAVTNRDRPEHERAVAVLRDWPARGTALYTSGQVLREYLAVATRPIARNGLGMARAEALGNARALRARLRALEESDKVTERLFSLLDTIECTGKQVHDANLVAAMLVHGVETLVTLNVTDFRRFAAHVRVMALP